MIKRYTLLCAERKGVTPYAHTTRCKLCFIASKSFDTNSPEGLQKALVWLRTTDGDNLMYGEPTGDDFDKMVGEMRRPMLIKRVIKNLTLS